MKPKWKVKKVKLKGENNGKRYLEIADKYSTLAFFKLEQNEYQFWFDDGSFSGNDYPESKNEINEFIDNYNNDVLDFNFIIPEIAEAVILELDEINPFEDF